MLRPTKHSHPDQTVVYVSFLLIKRLGNRRIEKFEKLHQYIKKVVRGGDVLFLPALNFLFLLDLITYRPKTDSVEYVGAYEAI
jgi:hypothetical protein